MTCTTATKALYSTLYTIYGNNHMMKAIHADVDTCEKDRYGTRVEITMVDGMVIKGRLSLAHNFTGTIQSKNGVKTFRSYHS